MKNTFTDLLIRKQTPFARNNITALIMRVSQVYLLILTSALVTMASPKGSGQSIENTTVKLEIVNKPLKQALLEIEKQTHFRFQWDVAIEKSFPKVNLPEGKYSVKDALDRLLQNTRLNYRQNKAHIIIIPSEEGEKRSEKVADEKAELTDASSVVLVTGTVKDAATQEPLAGVNIIVKGTTRGTTTDVEGKFGIEAEDSDVLVFSFIGFQPFETNVGGRTVIDVSMAVDVTALKEVVVNAGYWNVKERENTGSISQVSSEEIQKQPVSNPLAALHGRMPGVHITQQTGMPGGGFLIQVRGRNSLRSTSGVGDPLYVIDGVPFTSTTISSSSIGGPIFGGLGANPLNNLNPADIESIEVLKDADATAIYGSRGGNGVVLITTKKAKAGKSQVGFNFYQGVGKVTNMLDLLTTDQYLEMRREAFVNDEAVPGPTDYDLTMWDQSRYTDWQKELIGGTANTTDAQFTLSGGNTSTQFLFGGGFYRQSTVFPGDFADEKSSAHLNINHVSPDNKFKAALSFNYLADKNNLLTSDLTNQAIALAPNAPAIYDDNGNLNWENSTWINPLAALRRKYKGNTNNLIANGNLSYLILRNLSAKASIGYTNLNMRETSTNPISSRNPANTSATGIAFFGNSGISTWIVEPQLEYNASLGQGKVDILIGSTFQNSLQEGQTVGAFGFTNDALIENIQAASSVSIISTNFSEYRYNALFGRIGYKWREKYLINLTGRRDGSSRFGPDKRFANFGAVGVGWIFSEEKFINNTLSFLSFGKVRASYGVTGSDQIGDYQYLNTYSTTSNTYDGIRGLVPTRLLNQDYSWEENKKFEAALELAFLKDRLSLNSSWYRNRSSNQLVGFSLPAITGQSSIQYNLPATVENSGWEFELRATHVKTPNFTWSSSANLTIPDSKLVEYPNLAGSPYANTYVVGEPLNVVKTFQYLGVDAGTGVYTFSDLDGDGIISSPLDNQTLINLGQNFYGGFENSITYKGLQIDLFFQFVNQLGYNFFNSFSNPPGAAVNQPIEVMNRWQSSGDQADVQRFTQRFGSDPSNAYINFLSNSNKAISDASFVRLKNLSVSYDLPLKLIGKANADKARVYIVGQNLFTITEYRGMDPENRNARVLPPLKVIAAGIQLTF
ncbi:TonB-dependent receptor [Fulvivirgaceae bacterium PWU4]|uniref:TonB-dependent receptor n=1 Tax=Chryseosolibacter histidini TaxID=2782349 RepID=A0AAP2DR63_9BACT|nr:TonB-dependent receptor [Chryseosolibacter histidini]MBT1701041.1 TonB-dependent receptor [Chryseosolibacter histidini]